MILQFFRMWGLILWDAFVSPFNRQAAVTTMPCRADWSIYWRVAGQDKWQRYNRIRLMGIVHKLGLVAFACDARWIKVGDDEMVLADYCTLSGRVVPSFRSREPNKTIWRMQRVNLLQSAILRN